MFTVSEDAWCFICGKMLRGVYVIKLGKRPNRTKECVGRTMVKHRKKILVEDGIFP